MIVRLHKELEKAAEPFLLEHEVAEYTFIHLYNESLLVIHQDKAELVDLIRRQVFTKEIFILPHSYQLAASDFKTEKTIIDVKGQKIGGEELNLTAGPCAIESEEQIFKTARFLSSQGVKFLRGGAFKPRTSPYSFQGLGEEGLKVMRKAADENDLLIVTEVLDFSLLEIIYDYADILQVGSRNMYNYYFLKELGKVRKPILLKRGMYAKIEEWLLAAEYILLNGNENVILCERGIRTFDQTVRNTLDIAAVPLIKELSHLPVWVDPSQGTGKRSLVMPMSLAAVAAGTDGLMIEVHPDPEKALSDGYQSLNFSEFEQLVDNLIPVSQSINKNLYFQPIKN